MPEIIHNTTALCAAIINSNIEESISIINALTKNDLDERGSNPMSPLHLAAFFGHTAIFDALINKDVNPDLKDSKGQTPIQLAASNGHTKLVTTLIGRGVDCNQVTEKGNSLLHLSASKGHDDTLKALIGLGANVDIKNSDGESPLLIATAKCSVENVIALATQGNVNQVGKKNYAPIHYPVINGRTDVVKALLELGANPDLVLNGKTPLHIASSKGHEEISELLLSHGADVGKETPEGHNALHIAYEGGHEKIIKAILKAELSRAINSFEIKGNTRLHLASENGHVKAIEALLKDPRIDVNIVNNRGNTAFHLASANGHVKAIEALSKDPRIDVARVNKRGNTALHFACLKGHKKAIEALLKDPRIDVTRVNNRGNTALNFANKIKDEATRTEIKSLLMSANKNAGVQSGKGGFPSIRTSLDKEDAMIVDGALEMKEKRQVAGILESLRRTSISPLAIEKKRKEEVEESQEKNKRSRE